MPENPIVGVGVIVRLGNRMLLLKRKNVHGAGTWSTPGGHLDYGETPELCARREVKEETAVDISGVRFRAITSDVFQDIGKHYITIWMEANHAAGEPVVNASYEMSEVHWFNCDELPEPLFLPLKNLLDGNCYPRPGDWAGEGTG